MKLSSILVALMLLSSCASKPVLYPNKKLESVGKEAAQKDVDACLAKADQFLESDKGKQILKSAGKGSFVGAAMGAVTGLLFGDFKRAVTSGAVVGGAAGAAGESISPDRLKQAYTNRCLKEQGYDVMGWD